MFNQSYAETAKLTDVYYSACDAYTLYSQTGKQCFKTESDNYFAEYKRRGGKRVKLHMV